MAGEAAAAVTTVGAVAVTIVAAVAVPDTLPDVARMVVVAAAAGAVNRPVVEIAPPPVADHVNVGCAASGVPN
jgi:hypothetical protein